MRELAERTSRRVVGGLLVLLPVAIFVSVGMVPSDDTAVLEDEAVAFVLNQSSETFGSNPDSEISTRPTITTQTPETSIPTSEASEATTALTPNTSQTPEGRGHAALAKIKFPWAQRLPEWEISFHPERSGVYGYTLVNERRIEIYVRPDQSDELLAHVVAHEIGHAIDVIHNDGDERDRWLKARGTEGATWWPNDGASDFSTGAGDFAESFAAWQVGSESFRSKLGPSPTKTQLDILQQLALG